MKKDVLLGFLEEVVEDGPFSSLAGGTPRWMFPDEAPASVACGSCGRPLRFLLQLYAPIEERMDAFHRVLYLFVCDRATCLRSGKGSIAALRTQLSRDNPYYPWEKDGPSRGEWKTDRLCDWCATWKGNKVCSKCKGRAYCSREHQVQDWNAGHRRNCTEAARSQGDGMAEENPSGPRWKAWEIQVEPEVCSEDEDEEEDVERRERGGMVEETDDPPFRKPYGYGRAHLTKLAAAYESRKLAGEDPGEGIDAGDLESIEASKEHLHIADVQARIALAPDQCVRYCRGADQEILWMGLQGHMEGHVAPDCDRCGARRVFEFQVMPQILSFLEVEDEDEDAMDWGTLVVFTCENSCPRYVQGDDADADHATPTYLEEYVWFQPPL